MSAVYFHENKKNLNLNLNQMMSKSDVHKLGAWSIQLKSIKHHAFHENILHTSEYSLSIYEDPGTS